MYHVDACKLFLAVIQTLGDLNWQWLYHSVLLLGSIVLTAESSQIRKIALEEGLLIHISFGDHVKSEEIKAYAWTCRAACSVSLNHVYAQRKSTALGLLAQAAINARLQQETHPIVQRLLKSRIPEVNRLSAVFKYIGRSLAEDYTDTQNQLSDMRKYLQTAGKESTNKTKRKQNSVQKLNYVQSDLRNLKLSVEPYHANYKKSVQPKFNSIESLVKPSFSVSTKTSSLQSSYSCVKEDYVPTEVIVTKPVAGTANRRKLFNPQFEEDEEVIEEESEDWGIDIQITDYGMCLWQINTHRI